MTDDEARDAFRFLLLTESREECARLLTWIKSLSPSPHQYSVQAQAQAQAQARVSKYPGSGTMEDPTRVDLTQPRNSSMVPAKKPGPHVKA